MPAYNDTPNAIDRINDTQAPIKTNFLSLQTVVGVNHVIPITDANTGKHKFMQMPEQGASPTTAANEGALFTRQGVSSGETELCFRRESDGDVTELTATGGAGNGWTRLPSGILIKWGVFNHVPPAAQNHTLDAFPAAGGEPVFANVYSCSLTTVRTPADDVHGFLQSITLTNVNWYAERRLSNAVPAVAFSVYYIVIGD